MSYILDALKKSEQQRSLESLGKLRTPYAGGVRGDRRVVLVLLGVLVALVALLGAMAWWYRGPIGELVRGGPSPDSKSTVMAPAREEAPTGQAVIDSTREVGPGEEPAGEVPGADTRSVEPRANDAVSSEAGTEEAAGSTTASVPTAAKELVPVSELARELRERLPPLAVSVVSWSGDAARRFAMIDGGIYKEGDRLPEGIRVDKIRRDRIELSMLSERFYIQPENLPR